jgi:hypothetical protein
MIRFAYILPASAILFIACSGKVKQGDSDVAGAFSESIQLSGAFALYPMAVTWAE